MLMILDGFDASMNAFIYNTVTQWTKNYNLNFTRIIIVSIEVWRILHKTNMHITKTLHDVFQN